MTDLLVKKFLKDLDNYEVTIQGKGKVKITNGKILVKNESIARKYVEKRMNENYKQPSDDKISDMRDLLIGLNELDSEKVQKYAKKLNYEITRIVSSDILLFGSPWKNIDFSKKQANEYTAVSFFWRLNPMKEPGIKSTYKNSVDPLILEAPHEGTDGTLNSATAMFNVTSAKILLFNSVHNHGSVPPKNKAGKYESDGAHNTDTLFHKTHTILANMFPKTFVVQFHSMGGGENMHLLLVNSYDSQFTQKGISGPDLFVKELPNFMTREKANTVSVASKIIEGTWPGTKDELRISNPNREGYPGIYRLPKSAHNTNVQGIQLQKDSRGRRSDTGRFMHVEQTGKAKNADSYQIPMQKALNKMMKKWVGTSSEQGSKIEEVIYDPNEDLPNIPEDTVEETELELEDEIEDELIEPIDEHADDEEVTEETEPEQEPVDEEEFIIDDDDEETIDEEPEPEFKPVKVSCFCFR